MKHNLRLSLLSLGMAVAFQCMAVDLDLRQDASSTVARADYPISSMLVLSDKVGDVGNEAISMGVPTTYEHEGTLTINKNVILYLDTDSIEKSTEEALINRIRKLVISGGSAVIETSAFDFNRMHTLVLNNFPELAIGDVQDVAVLLYLDKGKIKAVRIDPSELAVYAGVPTEQTTSAEMENLIAENEASLAMRADLNPNLQQMLRFATKAYESTPGDGEFNLKYNGTYVDVWKAISGGKCIVAWRGTASLRDAQLDIGSQQTANIMRWSDDTLLQGGSGFIKRVVNYYNDVKQTLRDQNCTTFDVTGHSLGGAASQIHTIFLTQDFILEDKLRSIATWNSPLTITSKTRDKVYSFIQTNYYYNSMCRKFDHLVNQVPLFLVRLGPNNDTAPRGCTYVGPGVQTTSLKKNHSITLWWLDFPAP
jgi:hypothetical protein